MIYTLTFNPAIDYVMRLNELTLGRTNRSQKEEFYFGGKGINVSVVLKELDIPSKALGFVAGFTGAAIENGLQTMGIDTDFVHLCSGNSRINVKLYAAEETECNGQGPDISIRALDALLQKLDTLQEGDMLVLAGSVPHTLPKDIYEQILFRLQNKGVRYVVDATKELLQNTLKYKPFLIKPNLQELEELFECKITSEEQLAELATKLQAMGAQNVLISMAGNGAFLLDADGKQYRMGVPSGTVQNSVGAGDSMVAGFLAGYLQKNDYAYALKLGTACGSATAFSPGLAKRVLIDILLENL